MRVERCGDCAVLVTFGDRPHAELSRRIAALQRALVAARPAGLHDAVVGFTTLLLVYDPDTTNAHTLSELARVLMAGTAAPDPVRAWTLPVCYEADLAPDLAEVASALRLDCTEVVRRHTAPAYSVYLLGFSPGFPYLGDLDERLALPRRESPRPRVPAGSVAIATRYTAIYPQETPGGWHLIGRTPVRLFDAAGEPPALLQPGDRVRFTAIARHEFEGLAAAVAAGSYVPHCAVGEA